MEKILDERSVFNRSSPGTLRLMERLNEEELPTFILPTKFISTESAAVGYLLNELYMPGLVKKSADDYYKSFFANSGWEALQGAIKIIRHFGRKKFKQHHGKVLIYQKTGNLKNWFGKGAPDQPLLYPGIEVYNEFDLFSKQLNTQPVSGAIYCTGTETDGEELLIVQNACVLNNICWGCYFADTPLSEIRMLLAIKKAVPDLYIWEEQLTDYELPFGIFSMSSKVFKPWNNMMNATVHSSTYSGNALAMNKALMVLNNRFKWSEDHLATVAKIQEDYPSRIDFFAKCVNPYLVKLYKFLGYDFRVKKARGNFLEVVSPSGEKHTLLDCVSGGGLGVFGHNAADLVKDVLYEHSEEEDYWELFKSEIVKLTGFPGVFPAVSGATAVENAMRLALIAQYPEKKKIIVFSNNYSGKLLLPMVATLFNKRRYTFFDPIYPETVVIDPLSEQAEKELTAELEKGDTALIWFEYIQGSTGKKLPEPLVQIIKNKKEQFGYLVGIDEVLMGLYRSGPLFSYLPTGLKPDFISLSKPLSYLAFPTGVTLVAEEVYNFVSLKNPELIYSLKSRYKNQLGAHISWHVLKRIIAENMQEKVKENAAYLKQKLEVLRENNKQVKEIEITGMFFKIVLKLPLFVKIFGVPGEMIYLLLLTKYWIKEAGIFLPANTRFLPSLNFSKEEIDLLVTNANKVIRQKPMRIVMSGLKNKQG